jgi:hypothetical protein
MVRDRQGRPETPPYERDLPFELAGQSRWIRLGVALAVLASAIVSGLIVAYLISL